MDIGPIRLDTEDLVFMGMITFLVLLGVVGSILSGSNKSENAQAKAPHIGQELHAKASRLIAFFLDKMRPAGNPGLRRMSLASITSDRGRAANWDYILPSVTIGPGRRCWQLKMKSISEPGDWKSPTWNEVIIMPSGQWAVLGVGYRSMYRNGEERDIGMPFVIQSTQIPSQNPALSPAVAIALTTAMEAILRDHLPSALAEFQALRNS